MARQIRTLRATVLASSLAVLAHASASATCTSFINYWPEGPSATVARDGDYLYIERGAVLAVVDISVRASPVELSTIAFDSSINDLSAEGDLAVVGVSETLFTVDVSNRRSPRGRRSADRSRMVCAASCSAAGSPTSL